MLELSGVKAGYDGSEVLSGLSLSIAAGETVALLGRNGMGKTTTLRTIMGILTPMAGAVRFMGKDTSHLETYQIAQAGIAYVPQGRDIFGGLTVEENLRLGAMRGGSIDEAYELFPALKVKANEPGNSLSGGQQQQLALARALLTRPKLLLLDEPSEGIQPSIVQDIAELIRNIARKSGIAVLLVEQNTELALQTAQRALFIEAGRITGDFPAIDVSAAILREHMGL